MNAAIAPSLAPAREHPTIVFGGQTLTLLPEKAIWWAAQRALLVADVHLGKATAFRMRGMAVPAGATAADLERINRLIEQTGAERLIVLGDWVHAEPDARLVAQVTTWRQAHPALEVLLVRGNHDGHMETVPEAWTMQVVTEPMFAGLRLRHEPQDDPVEPELAGHIHPAVVMGRGRGDRLRAPIFWVRPRQLILPAFGRFTGGFNIRPERNERIFAVGPDAVVELP